VAVGPCRVGVAVGVPLSAVASGLEVVRGVGEAVTLLVAVAVPVGVDDAVRLGVGVVVRVGVGVFVGGEGVVPGTGITNTCPGRMIRVSWIPLASANASTLTPNLRAMSNRVSPRSTV
jgi:hypothetical protein